MTLTPPPGADGVRLTKRWTFSHCEACAREDADPSQGSDLGMGRAGAGCPADGPGADGCEAVWIEARAALSTPPKDNDHE